MEYILFYLKMGCVGILTVLWYNTIITFINVQQNSLSAIVYSGLFVIPLMRLFVCWRIVHAIVRQPGRHLRAATVAILYFNIVAPCIFFDVGFYMLTLLGIFTDNYVLLNLAPYCFAIAFSWLIYGIARLRLTIEQ